MNGYVVFLTNPAGDFQTRYVLPFKRPLPRYIEYGYSLYRHAGGASYRQVEI